MPGGSCVQLLVMGLPRAARQRSLRFCGATGSPPGGLSFVEATNGAAGLAGLFRQGVPRMYEPCAPGGGERRQRGEPDPDQFACEIEDINSPTSRPACMYIWAALGRGTPKACKCDFATSQSLRQMESSSQR